MAKGRRRNGNKVVAIVASIALVVGLMPLPAFAVSESQPEGQAPGTAPAVEVAASTGASESSVIEATEVKTNSAPAAAQDEEAEAPKPAAGQAEEAAVPQAGAPAAAGKSDAKAEEAEKADTKKTEEAKATETVEKAEEAAKAEEDKEDKEDAESAKEEFPAFKQSANAGGVTVTVQAGVGAFPKDARLSVLSVSSSATEAAVAPERGAGQNVAVSYTFDIKVLGANGAELQPADGKSVRVSFRAAEVADPNLDAHVYHVADGAGAAEELGVSEYGATATATSDGFSYYTVEFTYGDLQYVLQGGESIPLADVLAKVGLQGEPEAVEVSNPGLFSASDATGAWMVTSHKAFSSKEWMRVTIAGKPYEIAVTDEQSGECGAGLTWKLDDSGTLTISGEGGMYNYNKNNRPPWYDARDSIKTVVVGDGVTFISGYAFADCNNLANATIGNSVKSIAHKAFSHTALTSVTIPDSVESIDVAAFEYTALTSVTIPDSVKSIGTHAFLNCKNLAHIYYCGTAAKWKQDVAKTSDWDAFTPPDKKIHYLSALTVLVSPNPGYGQVTITSDPNAPASPVQGSYWSGTSVTVEATPADGYAFVQWNSVDSDGHEAVTFDNASLLKATFTMPENDVTVKARFAEILVEGIGQSYRYTGQPITPVPTKVSLDGVDMVLEYEEPHYSNNLLAGKATVVFTVKDNVAKRGTASREFEITERPLTVKAASKTKAYDGTPLTEDSYTSEGLAPGDYIESVTVEGAQTEVGSSANVPSVAKIVNANNEDVTDCYDITYEYGTLTINTATMTVEAVDYSGKYDGGAHEGGATPSVAEGTTVQYSTDGGETWSSTAPSIKDYGTVNYKVKATNPNCYDATADGALQVATRSVTLTSAGGEKVYDGSPLVKNAQTDVTVGGDGFVGNEGATYDITGAQTDVGSSGNEFTYTLDEGTSDANYEISKAEGTLTVTPATMTVEAVDYSGKYDGGAHEGGATPSVAEGTTVQYSTDGGETWSSTAPSIKDYGTVNYKVKATNPNYDDATAEGTLTVTKAKATVTITGKKSSAPYDGGEHSVSGYDVSTSSKLYTVDDFTFSGTAEAARTDAGTSYMGLAGGRFKNVNPNFDVTFNVTDGSIEIVPANVEVTVTGHHDATVFDGGEHSVSGYDVSTSSKLYTEDYFTFSGTAEAARTDAGTSYMGLAAGQFANTNPNFGSVTFTVTDGYQTIVPADEVVVTITGHHDATVFDGGEHSVSGYDVSTSNKLYTAADFTFSGTAEAARTDAGTSHMGLAADQFANTNPNFTKVTFHVTDGYQTIDKLAVGVTVSGNNGAKVYSGKEQKVEGYAITISNPLYTEADFTFSGKAVAKGTNAGAYQMGLSADQFVNDNPNFDAKFTVQDGALTIDKAPLTVTAKPQSYAYNGQTQGECDIVYEDAAEIAEKVAVEGLKGSDALTSVVLDGQGKDIGEYPLVPSDAKVGEATANYETTYVNGTLTITDAPTYTVKFVNYDDTVLQSGQVAYGETPKYEGETPVKPATAEHTYEFAGWEPEVAVVTGDATYKATFTEKAKKGVYEVVSGEGGSWKEGSSDPLVFVFKRTVDDETSFDHFVGILVDGNAVSEKDASGNANYTATKGSVIVALQPSYLATLSEGNHTLTALFDDGNNVEASLTVAAKAQPSPKPANKSSSTPKTGDGNRGLVTALLATALLALCAMAVCAIRRRKA